MTKYETLSRSSILRVNPNRNVGQHCLGNEAYEHKALTRYGTVRFTSIEVIQIEALWKRRNCSKRANFSFATMLYKSIALYSKQKCRRRATILISQRSRVLTSIFSHFPNCFLLCQRQILPFKLPLIYVFNLDNCKILSFGKELRGDKSYNDTSNVYFYKVPRYDIVDVNC